MNQNEYLQYVGERVDQLISLDVASRNVIHILYPLARRKVGAPLCMAAAKSLADRVKAGDVVVIATGWPDRPHITPEIAETDGPPGAAALARALHIGLGAVPLIIIEENLVSKMAFVVQATGFRILTPDQAIACSKSHAPIHGAAVISFPTDDSEAQAAANELLDKYSPSSVISVEKGGMNRKGKIHTSRGAETTGPMAKVDYLVLEAKRRGILTVGIGDGGNEIGMGVIEKEIMEQIPYGAQCKCGCGGGIAPSVVTDFLVTAAISNWGAYGIEACLAALLERPEVFHDPDVEERVLHEAARASFIDGITGYVELSADGLGCSVHKAFVRLLKEIVSQSLASYRK